MSKLEISRKENIFGDNLAYASRLNFSRGNLNNKNRLEVITTVASICYANPKAVGSESLYNRLASESTGLPSSAFEFVPVLLEPKEVYDVCENLGIEYFTNDLLIQGAMPTVDVNIIRFGQWITHNDKKYLLTNFRAIVYDYEVSLANSLISGKEVFDLRDKFNTEEECDIIESYYTVFKFYVDFPTRSQMVRHRVNLQEMCISGDSIIKTSQGARTIKRMYEIQETQKNYANYKYPTIKSYDFKKDMFQYVPIKEIFKTGTKKVYEVKIQYGAKRNSYVIKTTMDHKFLTKDGWARLESIKVGDYVALNGDYIYRKREWLSKMKEEFLAAGIGLKGMSKELGINYNTLKKWMHIFKLSYTPKEVASTYTVWNKNIKGTESHSYGRTHNNITREKISARLVKMLGTSKGGYRKRTASYWEAEFRRNKILQKFNHKCCKCESVNGLELDHKKPVAGYPWLAFDEDNMQVLCKECHKAKTRGEIIMYSQTKRYGMVESITEIGMEDTYDLEVDHVDHNYVANGIIVHNSRRYVSAARVGMNHYVSEKLGKVVSKFTLNELKEVTGNDTEFGTDLMNSIPGFLSEQREISLTTQLIIDICMNHYFKAIEDGVKPQEARRIIPQTGYTEFYMGFLPFQLENFLRLRADTHSQWEVQQAAYAVKELLGR